MGGEMVKSGAPCVPPKKTQDYLITAEHCFSGTSLYTKLYYPMLGDHNFQAKKLVFSRGVDGRGDGKEWGTSCNPSKDPRLPDNSGALFRWNVT
jgi:hypothetical protein